MILPYDFGTPDYLHGLALRDLVLRKPLGRSINNDPLETEYDQVHIGLHDEELGIIGTCTLKKHTDNSLQMRQVAVHPDYSGRGFGAQLVAYCERYAIAQAAPKLFCHAREVARPFYEKCGWVIEGEVFTEVGIPHYHMYYAGLAS
ncbi:MAG: GNAT family N-acetyltransferase [Saprospiraceae bacterium]